MNRAERLPRREGERGLTQDDTRSGDYFWSHHETGDELARLKLTEEFNVAVWGRKPLG